MQVRILLPSDWNSKMVMQWIRVPSRKKRYFKFLKTSVAKLHSA
ncbi:hypothetical protein ACFOG5_13950 [Pedobacter fastidiosus]